MTAIPAHRARPVAGYRLTPNQMTEAAESIGCVLLVPHTTRKFRWDWDGFPAVMVTNNSSDSGWWQHLSGQCQAVCLIAGRLHWKSMLQGQTGFYFGADAGAFRAAFGRFGIIGRPATSARTERDD